MLSELLHHIEAQSFNLQTCLDLKVDLCLLLLICLLELLDHKRLYCSKLYTALQYIKLYLLNFFYFVMIHLSHTK